jgi:hypothetical protein
MNRKVLERDHISASLGEAEAGEANVTLLE